MVQLFIDANAHLQLQVGNTLVGTSISPLSACPMYTHIEVQYRTLTAGGIVLLRMDGQTEIIAPHTSNATVSQTRIGVDDAASQPPRIRWDDHTFATGVVLPGDLSIIGLLPGSDGFYRDWSGQGCNGAPLFPCVISRPYDVNTFAYATASLAKASFCSGDPVAAGIDAPIVGVKTVATVREIPDVTALGGLFLRTGGCRDSDAVDSAETTFAADNDFFGVSRLDEVNPGTGLPWSADDLSDTELGIRHPDDTEQLFALQLMQEVIVDREPTSRFRRRRTRSRYPNPPPHTLTTTATPTTTITPSPTPVDAPARPTLAGDPRRRAPAPRRGPLADADPHPTERITERHAHEHARRTPANRHADGYAAETDSPAPTATIWAVADRDAD